MNPLPQILATTLTLLTIITMFITLKKLYTHISKQYFIPILILYLLAIYTILINLKQVYND